jgi:hypothetical protein
MRIGASVEALGKHYPVDSEPPSHGKLQPPQRANRWLTPVLLVLTLGVLSILLFARVGRTEIEMDAR